MQIKISLFGIEVKFFSRSWTKVNFSNDKTLELGLGLYNFQWEKRVVKCDNILNFCPSQTRFE